MSASIRPIILLARRSLLKPTTTANASICHVTVRSGEPRAVAAPAVSSRCFSSESSPDPPLPDSIKRVGAATSFPNEYPGQNYQFNWILNYDGVTPTKKSAFRITKPLDLKIAGLEQPKKSPLKVKVGKGIAEAGSDELAFETFDDVTQRVKDSLSVADHLYCPEGHAPTTRIGVRVICNSPTLAPNLVAYLDRAPKQDPPQNQPITAYVLEGSTEEFVGYAIEIVEDEGEEPKSVAAVVVAGQKPSIEMIAAGIELSVAGITADAAAKEEGGAAEE